MNLEKLSSLNILIQSWENLTESTKLDAIRELQKVGQLSTAPIREDESLSCPMHQFKLSQPCGLGECPYFVESDKDYNCLYHSLEKSKKGRMTINETSHYMNLPITEINKINNDALIKIRREYLREKIEEENALTYHYIPGHCVHCEEYIQDDLDLNSEPSLTIEYGKHGWCSLECKESKPEWKFRTEHNYSTSFVYVLKHAYMLVVTYSARSPDKEVDILLGLPSGTASNNKKFLREIL